MTALSVGGWLAASGAGVAAGIVRRALTGRMETVARACHELRGPLTAARLGLQLGASSGELTPARLRAIDLELGRAALALDDLDGARTREIRPWRAPEPVAIDQLVSDSVEAWRAAALLRGVSLQGSWSWRLGQGVGRSAAARAGDRQPDRECDRAWRRSGRGPRPRRCGLGPARGERHRSGPAGAGGGAGSPSMSRARGARARPSHRQRGGSKPRRTVVRRAGTARGAARAGAAGDRGAGRMRRQLQRSRCSTQTSSGRAASTTVGRHPR